MIKLKEGLFAVAALLLATLALSASANGIPKPPFSVRMSVPPGQTTAPFIIQAQITNESIVPLQSVNLSVSGVTIVGVNNSVDTFLLLPHLSFPIPPFAKVAFTGSSISITKDPMVWGETLTLTIAVNTCGDAQWSAAGFTGLLLDGLSFGLDAANSNTTTSIACGAPLAAGAPFVVPDSTNQSCVTGERGYYDKDGSIPGGSLSIFVTDTVPTNSQIHFRWLDFQAGGDPLATFEYDVCAAGNLPDPLPDVSTVKVAWLNTDGTPASNTGTPAYIAAQNCLQPDVLPAPYGTLEASLSADFTGPLVIQPVAPIDTTTPSGAHGTIPFPPGTTPVDPATPGAPFDVVIGTERLTLQLVCLDNDNDPTDTNDCSEYDEGEGTAIQVLARGVGGTAAAPHNPGVLVMSTPLPILPSSISCSDVNGVALPASQCHYTPLNQALMCVADRFNEEGGGHATTFIDIGGDGWGGHP